VADFARGAWLAERSGMTTIAALAFALLALCTPALADAAPPRPPAFKLRVTVHDGSQAHSFRIGAGPTRPCALASRKAVDQQVEVKVCVSDDAHLEINWFSRRGANESHGSSTLRLEPGTTATLGGERDARVEITLE
jgi:hypothetical protein